MFVSELLWFRAQFPEVFKQLPFVWNHNLGVCPTTAAQRPFSRLLCLVSHACTPAALSRAEGQRAQLQPELLVRAYCHPELALPMLPYTLDWNGRVQRVD